jgi:hypothetical protein
MNRMYPSRDACFAPLGVVCFALLAGGCATTGREFVASKTGILIPKISVCATGVSNNEACKPTDGGARWQSNSNFPYYSVAVNDNSSYQAILSEVARNYIGSPFYEGDIHALCKANVSAASMDAIVAPARIVQDFDLTAKLKETAVSDATLSFQAQVEAKAVPASASIVSSFRRKLTDDVASKVNARFLWVVMRYPGGKADIEKNEALRQCVAEQSQHNKSSLVTGVAGYVVLANKTSASIDSGEMVNDAVTASLSGRMDSASTATIAAKVGADWKSSVEKVVHIEVEKQDLTTTAYPLWVQFER